MPGPVCRLGDRNAAGGTILTAEPSVLVNGRPIAVLGNKVSPHAKHKFALTRNLKPTILARGKPVISLGNIDTCGHPRTNGSPTVLAG
jgi:uncharacterized Zn-binding protein involved in type VI secretion